jgi:hypothetical protein
MQLLWGSSVNKGGTESADVGAAQLQAMAKEGRYVRDMWSCMVCLCEEGWLDFTWGRWQVRLSCGCGSWHSMKVSTKFSTR